MQQKSEHSEDKRQHPRRSANVCTWLRFGGDHAVYATQTHDLGIQGARFSTVRPVSSGDLVMLTLQLGAGSVCIECKGKVCWAVSDPEGQQCFGVRFLDLLDEERLHLAQFLIKPAGASTVLATT